MNNLEANILYYTEAIVNYEYAYLIYITLAALCLVVVSLIVLDDIETSKKLKKIDILEAKIDLLTKG